MQHPQNEKIDISPESFIAAIWSLPYGSSPDMKRHAEGMQLIKQMIDAGADPSQLAVPGFIGSNSPTTPIIVASASDDAACLALLLSHPLANPNHVDDDGDTALIIASYHGNASCVALLAPISDPNIKDRQGRTALELAMTHGDPVSVGILAPLTDLSAMRADGSTARQIAEETREARQYIPLLESIHQAQILAATTPIADGQQPSSRPRSL